MNNLRSFAVGLCSGIIRNGLCAIAAWLFSTHPAIAQIFGPAFDPVAVEVIATVVAVVLVSVAGAILREMRHSKIIAAAFDEGANTYAMANGLPALPAAKDGAK